MRSLFTVQFSPDGKYVLVCTDKSRIILFRVHSSDQESKDRVKPGLGLGGKSGVGVGAGVERLRDVLAAARASERPGAWVPPHHAPAAGDFTWLDAPTMAHYMGVRAAAREANAVETGAPVLFLELIETPPARRDVFPLTKPLEALAQAHTAPLTHLVYAATWFSLSAFGSAIAWARFRRRAPGRQK